MKKILLIILAAVAVVVLVSVFIWRQQAGYTKVLTAKVVRQELATVVSGTGQIKPRTYANLGANAMGRVTHIYVKEGDLVKKGQIVATIQNVQQEAGVDSQQAAIAAAKTDIAASIANEKTAEANVEKAKADLEQKRLDWEREQPLYKAGIVAKSDYDVKKAAYDTDVATLNQCVAALNQARAQTDSYRGHMQMQVAALRSNKDLLDQTILVAPFDAIVTNEPVREGESVVPGIQNTVGSTLMTLADMSVITAEVKVDETDIVNIREGQPVEVTVDALPGKVFKGHVTLAGDQALLRSTGVATLQSTTGTEEAKDFKVVVTLDEQSSDLRPGLSTTAKITTAHKQNVLTLPIQALTMHNPDDDKAPSKSNVQAASTSPHPAAKSAPVQGVYVIENKSGKLRAKFVPVTTGITGATDIEVLSGLTEGQEIATGPYKTLRSLKDNSLVKRDTAKPVTPSTSGNS
ncbi:MAG: efflux RND transporter periplasmic adaptor subunit [Terracidiphilus sp.]|jgi:HlyD family secretion protein